MSFAPPPRTHSHILHQHQQSQTQHPRQPQDKASAQPTDSVSYDPASFFASSISTCYDTLGCLPDGRLGAASCLYSQFIFVVGGLRQHPFPLDIISFTAIAEQFQRSPQSIIANLSIDIHHLNLIDRQWYKIDAAEQGELPTVAAPGAKNLHTTISNNITKSPESTKSTRSYISDNSNSHGPLPRFFHSIITIKHKLYLYGGIAVINGSLAVLDDLWEFDLIDHHWSYLNNIGHARFAATLNIIHDTSSLFPSDETAPIACHLANQDSIVISGGANANDDATSSILIFSLATNQLVNNTNSLQTSSDVDVHNGKSFVIAYPFHRTSTSNDALMCFSSSKDNATVLKTYSKYNKTFTNTIIFHPAGDTTNCPVKELHFVQGFMVDNINMVVMGWKQRNVIETYLFNLPSLKWSLLDNSCFAHPTNFHLINAGFLWKHHGKLILLGANDTVSLLDELLKKQKQKKHTNNNHPIGPLIQNFRKIIVFDLSFLNILKFGVTDDALLKNSSNFKFFRQLYKNEIIKSIQLSDDESDEPTAAAAAPRASNNIYSYEDLATENYPGFNEPNSNAASGVLPVDKESSASKNKSNNTRAQFQKNIDFESYVNYLVPNANLNLNSNSVNFYNNSAVALGRNFYQRYLLHHNNSLADFQIVGTDEKFQPVPLNLLIKRWGPYFCYILAVAYLKNLQALSKKLDQNIDNSYEAIREVAAAAADINYSQISASTPNSNKRHLSSVGGLCFNLPDHRQSIALSHSSNVPSDLNEDETLIDEKIFKSFKSPLSFALNSKKAGISLAEAHSNQSKSLHIRHNSNGSYPLFKNSVVSGYMHPITTTTTATTTSSSPNTNSTASVNSSGKIIFNSPFENNKKITITSPGPFSSSANQNQHQLSHQHHNHHHHQQNISPSLTDALNNYSEFINLPSSRKNSVISNPSSFTSNNSDRLSINNPSASKLMLNKAVLASTASSKERLSITSDSLTTGASANSGTATSTGTSATGTATATTTNTSRGNKTSSAGLSSIPEQPPMPDFAPPSLESINSLDSSVSLLNSRSSVPTSDTDRTSTHNRKKESISAYGKFKEEAEKLDAAQQKEEANRKERRAAGENEADDHKGYGCLESFDADLDLTFKEVKLFMGVLDEYKRYHEINDPMTHNIEHNDSSAVKGEDQSQNESKDGADGEGDNDGISKSSANNLKSHYLLEPLLVPRTLYMPCDSQTIKAFTEFLLTGQLNNKITINPVLIELYLISKFYEVPLLYNLCSEVLYAAIGKKENFVMNYLSFLEFELGEMITKSEQQKVEIEAALNFANDNGNSDEVQGKLKLLEINNEVAELHRLKKGLQSEFSVFTTFMKNIDYSGNYMLYVMKTIADYNLKLRKNGKNAASKKDLDNANDDVFDSDDDLDDDGYETDEMDDLINGLLFDQKMPMNLGDISGNLDTKIFPKERRASFVKIEDLINSPNPPSDDLISLIYQAATSAMDNRLTLRSLYLLMTIKLLNDFGKPIEAKIKNDLAKEVEKEEREAKRERAVQKKLEKQQRLEQDSLKRQQRLEFLERERWQVERERFKEEQRLKKERLRKLFHEQKQNTEAEKASQELQKGGSPSSIISSDSLDEKISTGVNKLKKSYKAQLSSASKGSLASSPEQQMLKVNTVDQDDSISVHSAAQIRPVESIGSLSSTSSSHKGSSGGIPKVTVPATKVPAKSIPSGAATSLPADAGTIPEIPPAATTKHSHFGIKRRPRLHTRRSLSNFGDKNKAHQSVETGKSNAEIDNNDKSNKNNNQQHQQTHPHGKFFKLRNFGHSHSHSRSPRDSVISEEEVNLNNGDYTTDSSNINNSVFASPYNLSKGSLQFSGAGAGADNTMPNSDRLSFINSYSSLDQPPQYQLRSQYLNAPDGANIPLHLANMHVPEPYGAAQSRNPTFLGAAMDARADSNRRKGGGFTTADSSSVRLPSTTGSDNESAVYGRPVDLLEKAKAGNSLTGRLQQNISDAPRDAAARAGSRYGGVPLSETSSISSTSRPKKHEKKDEKFRLFHH